MKDLIEFITPEEVKALPLSLDIQGCEALRALLNEALTRVHHRAVETAMLSMPDTITYLLKHQAAKAQLARTFLSQNQDLARAPEFKEALAEVEALHAGWSYEQMLAEAARLARERRAAGQSLAEVSAEAPNLEAADEALNGAL